jgi:hypothetical protein
MFDSNSRYAQLNTANIELPAGDGTTRTVRYVQRRIIPPPDTSLTLSEHTVIEGDRLDNIAALYLDDPTAFWMICDSNNVLRPTDLTETIGRVIKIDMPQT